MRPYSKYTDRELSGILSKHEKLSLAAKKELKKEFLYRDIEIDPGIMDTIDKEIELEHQKISDLSYLKNLGLRIDQTDDQSFQLRRSTIGKTIDVIAIIVGILISIVGLFGLGNLATVLSEKLNIFSLIIGIVMVVIGAFGFKMIFNGVSRLIEYASFNFTFDKDTFYVKKPLDIKPSFIEGKISELYIKNFENRQSLMYKDLEILKVNAPNIFNSNTLQTLLKRSQQLSFSDIPQQQS